MNNIQTYYDTLKGLPTHDYTAALAFLGAGAIVSVLVEIIRHYKGLTSLTRDVEDHTAAVSRALVTALSFIMAASQYIINGGNGPLALVFSHTAIILAAAHIVYWLGTQPLYTKFVGLLKDAENYRSINAPQKTANTTT